ncbi:unnamed protein product, partial [Polarella glacialis]
LVGEEEAGSGGGQQGLLPSGRSGPPGGGRSSRAAKLAHCDVQKLRLIVQPLDLRIDTTVVCELADWALSLAEKFESLTKAADSNQPQTSSRRSSAGSVLDVLEGCPDDPLLGEPRCVREPRAEDFKGQTPLFIRQLELRKICCVISMNFSGSGADQEHLERNEQLSAMHHLVRLCLPLDVHQARLVLGRSAWGWRGAGLRHIHLRDQFLPEGPEELARSLADTCVKAVLQQVPKLMGSQLLFGNPLHLGQELLLAGCLAVRGCSSCRPQVVFSALLLGVAALLASIGGVLLIVSRVLCNFSVGSVPEALRREPSGPVEALVQALWYGVPWHCSKVAMQCRAYRRGRHERRRKRSERGFRCFRCLRSVGTVLKTFLAPLSAVLLTVAKLFQVLQLSARLCARWASPKYVTAAGPPTPLRACPQTFGSGGFPAQFSRAAAPVLASLRPALWALPRGADWLVRELPHAPRRQRSGLQGQLRRQADEQNGFDDEDEDPELTEEEDEAGLCFFATLDSSCSCSGRGEKLRETWHAQGPFSAANGDVVTWGRDAFGGNSSAVAGLLREGVVQVSGTCSAFAAIKANGSVVTWGNARHGGDSLVVAPLLTEGVVQVCGIHHAFAAIKANGSVVTWGRADYGGDSSAVALLLAEGVVQVCKTPGAFAAIKANGSVVTWGDAEDGGDSTAVALLLTEGVVQVCGNTGAFAAIKENGSVVTWGRAEDGGDSSAVALLLTEGVVQVCGKPGAFAAIKENGSVVTWGDADYGGNSSAVALLLTEGVVQVCGNTGAFAAIKENGSVVTWGDAGHGGNSSAVALLLTEGVVQVCGTKMAFAAIKANGSVVTWGRADYGGDSSAVALLLTEGVFQVCGNQLAFAAIKANGSVVTWGRDAFGGNSTAVAGLLTEGVVQVCGTIGAFAAIKANGSVVTWGDGDLGGNSPAVAALLREGVVQVC